MSFIKNKLIKIAYENPELRGELLPVIMKIAQATVHSINDGVLKRLQDEAWQLAQEESSIHYNLSDAFKYFNLTGEENSMAGDWLFLIAWGLKHFSRKYQGELKPIQEAAEDAINPKKLESALVEVKEAGIEIPAVLSQWVTKYEDWCRRVVRLPQFEKYSNN
jgi:hypothetical protein